MSGTGDWISVHDQVPDDRRTVLAWVNRVLRSGIAVTTRYNRAADGSGYFECDRYRIGSRVTHWMDIEPPAKREEAP